MIAVDTNVVVRLLVDDDREQARCARSLFEQNPIWIGVTVLLDKEWVLRSAYDFSAWRSTARSKSFLDFRR